MDDIMLLYVLRRVVRSTVENQIAWLHLMELKVDRQGVKLIGLVSSSKTKAKFGSQVIDSSTNESTAVEKERCVIQRVIWLAIALGIWDANILLTLFCKFLSKPVLKFLCSVSSVVGPWHNFWSWQTLFHKLTVRLLKRLVCLCECTGIAAVFFSFFIFFLLLLVRFIKVQFD